MEVVDNTEMRHFEVRMDESLAIIEYQIQEKKYFLTHVDFPENFVESGKADEMVSTILDLITEKKMRVVPMTKFVKSHFKANRSRRSLLPVGMHL